MSRHPGCQKVNVLFIQNYTTAKFVRVAAFDRMHLFLAAVILPILLVTIAPHGSQAATILTGDHTIEATQTEDGDLTIAGSLHIESGLDFGTTSETTPQAAVNLFYGENGAVYTMRMSAARDDTRFLWEQNAGGTAELKMKLAHDNVLSLYDATTGAEKITFNPNTGKVTLGTGGGIVLPDGTLLFGASNFRSTALYDTFGDPKLTVDANGDLLFTGRSIAMGSGTTASGYASTAMGSSATASGDHSTAMGSSLASGVDSTAMGGSTASGVASTAMGNSTASGLGSIAMGVASTATGFASVAIGYTAISDGPAQLVIGHLNSQEAIPPYDEWDPSTWPSSSALFTIGNGLGAIWDDVAGAYIEHRSNAFVVRRNGNAELSGDLEVGGVIRVPESGDLSMGEFAPAP